MAEILEKTRIENILFSDITMTNIYLRPVEFEIDPAQDTPCDSIEGIVFRNIRSVSLAFPSLVGRKDCPLKDISFVDCDFCTVRPEAIAFTFEATTREWTPLTLRYTENVTFDRTVFSSKD